MSFMDFARRSTCPAGWSDRARHLRQEASLAGRFRRDARLHAAPHWSWFAICAKEKWMSPDERRGLTLTCDDGSVEWYLL